MAHHRATGQLSVRAGYVYKSTGVCFGFGNRSQEFSVAWVT